MPELFTADPGHGERFVAEGAGVLDYTRNRRTEQELRSEALPRRSCLAADASSAWFFRAVVLAGPLSVVAVIAGWVVTEVGRQPWVVYRVMPTDAAVTGANGTVAYAALACTYLAVGGGLARVLRRLARAPLDLAPDAGPAPRVA